MAVNGNSLCGDSKHGVTGASVVTNSGDYYPVGFCSDENVKPFQFYHRDASYNCDDLLVRAVVKQVINEIPKSFEQVCGTHKTAGEVASANLRFERYLRQDWAPDFSCSNCELALNDKPNCDEVQAHGLTCPYALMENVERNLPFYFAEYNPVTKQRVWNDVLTTSFVLSRFSCSRCKFCSYSRMFGIFLKHHKDCPYYKFREFGKLMEECGVFLLPGSSQTDGVGYWPGKLEESFTVKCLGIYSNLWPSLQKHKY